MKKQTKYRCLVLVKGLSLFMAFIFLLFNASNYYILKSATKNSKANQYQSSSPADETGFQLSENNTHILKSQVFVELIEVLELEEDEIPCVLISSNFSLFKTFFSPLFSYYNYSKKPFFSSHPIFLLFKVFRL